MREREREMKRQGDGKVSRDITSQSEKKREKE